ncbi:FUSC family protein [Actinacidiphila yeochonensis]|uniref:FUSC family protein n=1 Tax=Actinacidiphila yeochonensis TaxID=89050 RepID=UPI000A509FAA|nr:FUSC family protein [Actinacidiphila yeochonensis]
MTRTRRALADLWDRYAASDPGLLRLMAGLRTVGSIGLALVALSLLGSAIPQMVAGAIVAMVSTFAIREKRRGRQAVTLALGLPTALASVSLGAVLNQYVVIGDIFFVLLIFGAAYVRRFGERWTALGLIGFQVYFVSLFVHATPSALPRLWLTLAIAFACSALARFAFVTETPERTLRRLRQAFRARTAQLVDTQREVLTADAEDLEDVVAHLRKATARLHETALMIQDRLEDGTRDEATANLVQRRVVDAEIAAERLGILLLNTRSTGRTDTLTLHLPGATLSAAALPLSQEDEAVARLGREMAALHLLVTRLSENRSGTAVTMLRNRLLAYRDEKNVPQATPAVQDAFRGVGEAARAVLGLRLALEGTGVADAEPDSDDAPETTRSREEFEAEDLALADQDAPVAARTGLDRRTTRAAFQVATGSALAVVGGEFLSSQRWYWAVLTCWVVFLNTTSTAEILVKGYRRLIGTIAGVVAGVLLAGAVGHHTWTAFSLVLVLIFAMFFTAPLSYALMSFFVTAMLGLLYTLLHTYSLAVLVLRIEETALGAACGFIAAVLVLPVHTDEHTDEQLITVLGRLRDVSTAAVDQLSGGPATDLVDMARDLDSALDALRRSTAPLVYPITPLRVRRQTARYLVALLETCAYHARSLAATSELVPHSNSVAADPRLAATGPRLAHNIDALIAHLRGEDAGQRVRTGPSIASMFEGSGAPPGLRSGTVTYRVLRHLQRLDESVAALARPLKVPTDRDSAAPGGAPRPAPSRP